MNAQRYQGLLDELSNAFLNGRDEYPRNLVGAYKLVTNWKGDVALAPLKPDSGLAFSQSGTTEETSQDASTNATRGRLKRRDGTDVECVICGGNHFPNDCPKKDPKQGSSTSSHSSRTRKKATVTITDEASDSKADDEDAPNAHNHTTVGAVNYDQYDEWDQNISFDGLLFMSYGMCEKKARLLAQQCKSDQEPTPFDEALDDLSLVGEYGHILQQGGGAIDKLWTLLDSQSTVNVVCNPKMLRHIKRISVHLRIHSTGGISKTNLIGLLPGYGWVWFHPTGIANILSLARVVKHH